MGRACSKVAPQEITSPSSLQYVNSAVGGAGRGGQHLPTPEVLQDLIQRLAPETGPLKFLTNRLQLKIQEIQVGRAYTDLKPPHEQIFEPPPLTDGFDFYVSIYELRLRGLLDAADAPPQPTAAGLAQRTSRRALSGSAAAAAADTAEYVALVSWDNNSEYIRTTFERLDDAGALRFPGHWNFLWRFEGNRLGEMEDRYLLIALFRLEHLRNASLVGYSVVDILSITVGPIHHDFAFHRWLPLAGGAAPAPRLQFECRLTQICHLNCVPVEVSVAIDGGLGGALGAGGVTPSTEPMSAGTPPPQGPSGCATPLSPETPRTAAQLLAHAPANARGATDADEFLHTDKIPPKAKSVSNLGAIRTSTAPAASSAGATSAPSNALVDRCAVGESSLQRKASAIAEVDALDGPTQNHKTDDEKALVKAEWKVDFAVTGIPNVVPSASTWSAVTSAPYWLAVDAAAQPAASGLNISPVGAEGLGDSERLSDALNSASGYQFSVSNPSRGRRPRALAGGRATAGTPAGTESYSSPMSYKLETPGRSENVYQAKYRALALACQQSGTASFVKTALPKNSCLQPFYLLTTSEGIRQYYLLVRLWHKPLGVGSAKLFGEALIPFFKLFDADIVPCRSFLDVTFTETLWSDGRNVGQISALLVFQDIPVLRQMFAGISTEAGYRRLISPIVLPAESQSHVTAEIAALTQLTQELERHWLKTNVIHAEKLREVVGSSPKSGIALGCSSNVSDISEKLIELLSRSSSCSDDTSLLTPIFHYPSVGCLMEGQKILIELGNHILISQDFLPWTLRGVLGNILILILKRGELEIGNVLPSVPKQFQDRGRELHALYLQASRSRVESRSDLTSSQRVTTSTASSALEPIATISCDDYRELSHFHERMQIALSYAEFLFQLLGFSNEKVQSEAMFESQRKQIAAYYAILFSRVPALRSQMLQTVLTNDERELYINEWRGIDFTLDKSSLLQRDDWSKRPWPGLYELQLNLDWTPLYDCLTEYFAPDSSPRETTADAECSEKGGSLPLQWQDPKERTRRLFESQPRALDWLNPRSITFHLFLNSLIRLTWSQLDYNQQRKLAGSNSASAARAGDSRMVKSGAAGAARIFSIRGNGGAHAPTSFDYESLHSVSRTKGSVTRAALGNLRWDLIPGYASLLKAFLLELRDRPVSKFPDALLNCSATLLVNDRLLAVFMRIVLTRTSVYSREQVFSAFNYLDFWFEVFTLKNLALPLTMDYRLLSKAIDAVIISDLALQTAKTIWFLYKRMDLFVSQKSMLKILMDLILYRHFHRLLLHWSWLVRRCFTHFLLYRVCENARRLVAKHSQNSIDPPQIGVEERLLLWSYLLISESVKSIGIPPIFPEKFANVSSRRLLGQPLPPHQKHASPVLLWNIPAVLATVPPASPVRPPPPPRNAILNVETPSAPDDSTAAASLRRAQNSPGRDQGRSWMIRRPAAFKFRKRKSVRDLEEAAAAFPDDDEVLQDPTGVDDVPVFEYEAPEQFLPTFLPIPKSSTPYIQHITVEFAAEVEQYKLWVISGKAEVPPMHIPASPLDTNVDVPLEDD